MKPRVSLITLGVRDVARSRAFYEIGLGWPVAPQSVERTVFIQLAGGVVLSLYGRVDLAADAGLRDSGLSHNSFGGVALAQNVASKAEVDAILAKAEAAGATILKPAQDASWGGYGGYFADPDGHPWEIAWNPFFPLTADGGLALIA